MLFYEVLGRFYGGAKTVCYVFTPLFYTYILLKVSKVVFRGVFGMYVMYILCLR